MLSQEYKDWIAAIMEQPYAPMIIAEAQTQLAEERRRREQFYNEISEYEKAEFINGEIIIHSPVKKEHNEISGAIYRLLSTYVNCHELGYVGYEKIMITLQRNDYEPDICYFKPEKAKDFKSGQSLFPAPDLVVEVLSPKTAKNDRGIKFDDYEAHGIEEYWIVDPRAAMIEQYRLKKGQYELQLKAGEGHISCQPLQNARFDIAAFFDAKLNLEALRELLR